MKPEAKPELPFSEQCALCVERLVNDRPWFGASKFKHVLTAIQLLSAAGVFAAAREANETPGAREW